MKKTLLTFSVSLAVICCTLAYAVTEHGSSLLSGTPVAKAASEEESNPNVGVSIGTVDAQAYYGSGLSLNYFGDAEYVAKTSDETYMGFYLQTIGSVYDPETGEETYDDGMGAIFVALNSTEESVTIPDYLRIGEDVIPVTGINSSSNLRKGFTDNVKNLTVPATITNITMNYSFDQYLDAMYMLGAAPQISSRVRVAKIYVCQKENLSGYLNNQYYAYASILPFGWDFDWITVNVEKKGEFADTYLTQNDYDWSAGRYVKVIGNINDIDLNAIKNLTSLMKLDLSETSISALPESFMYNRTSLAEIKLPSTLTKIGNSAFYGCVGLQTVELNGIKEIGSKTFYGCSSLSTINLNGVESIDYDAFYNCYKLNGIDLSTALNIGYQAFANCTSLEAVDLTSAVKIGGTSQYDGDSFYNCTSLKNVVLGNNLSQLDPRTFANTGIESISIPGSVTYIGQQVFQNCKSLTSVEIPGSVGTIDSRAFYGCTALSNVVTATGLVSIGDNTFDGCTSLEEIMVPATVLRIGAGAFDNTAIKTFKCYAAVPPAVTSSFIGTNMDMARVYLYVPPFSKDFYRNTEYWSNFYLMRSIDDQVDYLLVDRPLTINLEEEDNAVVANNPEILLTTSVINNSINTGQLTATGEGTLSAGQLSIVAQMTNRYGSYYGDYSGRYQYCPTLINYADKMRADNVSHKMSFYSSNGGNGEWHFISLPYDVKVADIIPGDYTYWVIRRYDAAARAAGEMTSTWVDLTEDDTLEAGKGYIISVYAGYDEDGYAITPSLSFSSGNSLTKNNIFRPTDIIVPLSEYTAEFAHNRSWNFIGNPYPCYFDMHCLNEEFTAPVTIWNGYSYVAYSPVDDDLVLSPYEAFFVQCPLNATEMIFKEEGRMHANEGKNLYKTASNETIIAEGRNVFNFVISGDNYEDRTRIVLDNEAKSEYEIGRDASKFFVGSKDNAEIYVNADVAYSINERPVADGTATLGIRSSKENVYTLSLNGKFSGEWHVMLTDNETGVTVDLTKEPYQFTSASAENSSRFSVKFMLDGNGQSDIDSIIADFGEDSNVTVTAINGVVVYTGPLSKINVPASGLYLISNGKDSRKAILK